MSIVTMKRFSLLSVKEDKDKIFDALVRSNAVQLRRTADIPMCRAEVSSSVEQLWEKINRAEDAIRYLSEQTEAFNAEHKHNKQAQVSLPKNSFARPKTEIDFNYFLGFGANVARIEEKLANLTVLRNHVAELENLLAQNSTEYEKYAPYGKLPHPTTWYKDTENATVQLSHLPTEQMAALNRLAAEYELVQVETVSQTPALALVVVFAHKSQVAFWEKAAALGLTKCSITCNVLPKLLLDDLSAERKKLKEQLADTLEQIVGYAGEISEWKIYIDYINLCAQKVIADGELQKTDETFIMEGYCPAEDEAKVRRVVEDVSCFAVLYFYDIAEDEFAPTLVKNNPVVKQFEAVTNMYTPPSYHEIDPNPTMSVFYFLIFGFMVADIGYGALLVLAGLFAAFAIKQPSGLKTLLQLFGICGISAIGVGAMFGSCFSFSLYQGIIPDPSTYPMVMIIISLIVGLIHVIAGVGCKMAVKYKQKQALAAWFADFPWILVFLGLVLAIWNAAVDMANYEPYKVLLLPAKVSKIALYVCLGSLAVGLVFAGLGTKGVKGKMMKSFGSAYSIISYFSDVMSYIRIFGLMLSSALIGSVINMLGTMVAGGGGIGYIFAGLVLVLAHLFNLVMGCLSVYIHNGRLQYVEFFGKFYTGDGQLFVPFGSDTKYTLLKSSD